MSAADTLKTYFGRLKDVLLGLSEQLQVDGLQGPAPQSGLQMYSATSSAPGHTLPGEADTW